MSTTANGTGGELREGYAEIGDQRLHYVEAGDGRAIACWVSGHLSWGF